MPTKILKQAGVQLTGKETPYLRYRGDDYKVTRHRYHRAVKIEAKGSEIFFNSRKIELHVTESQKEGRCQSGLQLWSEVKSLKLLNINALYLLEDNPALIPEKWKFDERGEMRYVCFWGSQFRINKKAEHDVIEMLYYGRSASESRRWMHGGLFIRVSQVLGPEFVSAIVR